VWSVQDLQDHLASLRLQLEEGKDESSTKEVLLAEPLLLTSDHASGHAFSMMEEGSAHKGPNTTKRRKKFDLGKISPSQSELSCDKSLSAPLWKLCVGALGIYVSFLTLAAIEEDLFRYRSVNGEAFAAVWLLRVYDSAAGMFLGLLGRCILGSSRSWTGINPFILPATSQVFSKALSSASLAFGLSFPVQVLAKSAKMVPVMLGQMLLGGSSFSLRDYLFAGLLVTGTALLSLGNSDVSSEDDAVQASSTWPAGALIVGSLVMDGLTGGLQKRLQRDAAVKEPVQAHDFLFFTNITMMAIALVCAHVTGEWWTGYNYMAANAEVRKMIMLCTISSACGQFFVFYVIASADPLVCSALTSSRKMLSVMISIFYKGHHLDRIGTSGLLLAVAGLVVELEGKISSARTTKQPPTLLDQTMRRASRRARLLLTTKRG
jgi:UDP-galactose transporter B1